jgi:hypothetical protein
MKPKQNPWDLSPRQIEVMEAMCKLGCAKLVAKDLNLSLKTIHAHLYDTSRRMRKRFSLTKYLAWDRWRLQQRVLSAISALPHDSQEAQRLIREAIKQHGGFE